MYTPGVWLGCPGGILTEQVSVPGALWLLCSCISEAADAAAEQIKALYKCGTGDRISSAGFFFSLSGDLLERVSPQANLSSEI